MDEPWIFNLCLKHLLCHDHHFWDPHEFQFSQLFLSQSIHRSWKFECESLRNFWGGSSPLAPLWWSLQRSPPKKWWLAQLVFFLDKARFLTELLPCENRMGALYTNSETIWGHFWKRNMIGCALHPTSIDPTLHRGWKRNRYPSCEW